MSASYTSQTADDPRLEVELVAVRAEGVARCRRDARGGRARAGARRSGSPSFAQQLLAPLGVPLDDVELLVASASPASSGSRRGRRACPCRAAGHRPRARGGARARGRAPRRPGRRGARRGACAPRCTSSCSASSCVSAPTWPPRNASSAATSWHGAQVAEQRARLSLSAAEVERDREADRRDPEHLEPVADPPAEIHVGQEQRRGERRREPRDPDDDEQVGRAPREPVRAERAPADESVEGEADAERDRTRARTAAPAQRGRGSGRRARRSRALRRPRGADPGARAAVEPRRAGAGPAACRARAARRRRGSSRRRRTRPRRSR